MQYMHVDSIRCSARIPVYNTTKVSFTGLILTNEHTYLLGAIRKALLNAIVYRRPCLKRQPFINIYDNLLDYIKL